MRRFVSSSGFFAVLFSSSVVAFASSVRADDLKEAEKLYGAAAKDMAAGNHARACPTFEAAKEKAPEHVRTGMTLAQCYAEWGKPGNAFDELQRVRVFALLQNKQDKVKAIDEQVAGIRKTAPLLAIRVPAEIKGQSGLSILSNGKAVPASQWDTGIPVNPGTYRIEATASGKDPWETSVDVTEQAKTVTVTIMPPSWGLAGQSGGDVPTNRDSPPAERSSKMRAMGFVGLALGGAGLAIGGILGGLAISKNKEGAAYCNAQNVCEQAGYDLRLDAYNLANGSSAAFVAGAVLAGAGVLLVGLSPSAKRSSETSRAIRVETWIGPSSLGIRGNW